MAIAVTLLVLPLVDRAASAHVNSYNDFVNSFGHLLLIFLLSFVVICRYWEAHHDIFNNLQSFNTRLFWLNAGWLISIALIPFTSEIIGNDTTNSTFVTGLYIVSLLIASYIGVAMQWEIIRSPSIQKPSAAKTLRPNNGLAGAIAMTLALVVSILFPSVGVWALLLVIPASHFKSLVRRKPPTGHSSQTV